MTMKTKEKTIRRPKKIVRKLMGIGFLVVAIYLGIGVCQEVYTTVKLRKQADEVAAQLAILESENASLMQKRDKLEDPNYVETYARGEYMFSKDNEKIFFLPGTTATPTTEPEAKK